jgi:preprotein translocase subunit SecG
MYYLMTGLYILVCFLLQLAILLQQGKGGDIGSAFGGGGSQAAFGARTGATVLTKFTTIASVLFMIGALTLGILGRRGPASLVGGTPTPVTAPITAPATPPAAPIPAPAPTEGAGAAEDTTQ